MKALYRTAAALASSGRRGANLLILTYHRVLPEFDGLLPDDPDAAQFAVQMSVLAESWRVMNLTTAADALRRGALPRRCAVITFDDGYADNHDVALPILQRYGLTATFFVSTGFLDGGRMWNDSLIEAVRRAPERFDLRSIGFSEYRLSSVADRLGCIRELIKSLKHLHADEREVRVRRIAELSGANLPTNLMMTREQVRRLARAGMEIGAHTVSHPVLAAVEPQRACREILGSRSDIEAITGAAPTSFAYPNGRPGRDFLPEHVQHVRDAGFACAVTTTWGAAKRASDSLQLPRIAPWDRTAAGFRMRLLRAYL